MNRTIFIKRVSTRSYAINGLRLARKHAVEYIGNLARGSHWSIEDINNHVSRLPIGECWGFEY